MIRKESTRREEFRRYCLLLKGLVESLETKHTTITTHQANLDAKNFEYDAGNNAILLISHICSALASVSGSCDGVIEFLDKTNKNHGLYTNGGNPR